MTHSEGVKGITDMAIERRVAVAFRLEPSTLRALDLMAEQFYPEAVDRSELFRTAVTKWLIRKR